LIAEKTSSSFSMVNMFLQKKSKTYMCELEECWNALYMGTHIPIFSDSLKSSVIAIIVPEPTNLK
jgi:hypothetical protein